MATLGQIMSAVPGIGDAQKYVEGPKPQTGNQPLTLGNYLKEPKKWQKVLGIIGDGLQAAAGGRPTFMPMLQQQRRDQMEMDQAYDLAERQYNDRLRLKQWERDNPAPEKPTEFQRNYDWLLKNDPEAAANYKSRQTNDTVWRQGPDGRFYAYDPTPSLPQKPVGKITLVPDGDRYGNAPADPGQATRMRAELVRQLGPARGESEYQKWLQAYGGR